MRLRLGATRNASLTKPTVTNQNGDISSALLERARNVAKEHASATAKLAVDFDPAAAKKLGQLTSVTTALKEWESANEVLHLRDRSFRKTLTRHVLVAHRVTHSSV